MATTIIALVLLQAWFFRASMPTPRYGFGIGVVADQVFLIGGRNSSGQLSTVECYHPVPDSWSTGYAPMPTARYYVGSATYGGKIYIIGGHRIGGGGVSDQVERYDPASNSWETCPSMPTAREGLAAVVLNGRIYAIGGHMGSRYLRTVESFDPQGNTWRREDSLQTARAGAGAVTLFDTIYVSAGGQYSPLSSTEYYFGSTWQAGISLGRSRIGPSAAPHHDYIYLCGGEVPSESTYTSIEVYDRTNRTWVFGERMNQARSHHGSAVAGDYLYVFGGRYSSTVLGTTEGLRLTGIEEESEPRLLPHDRTIASVSRTSLSIRAPTPGYRCQVIDAAGRMVFDRLITARTMKVRLSPGVYFVCLSHKTTRLIRKVIVVQ